MQKYQSVLEKTRTEDTPGKLFLQRIQDATEKEKAMRLDQD